MVEGKTTGQFLRYMRERHGYTQQYISSIMDVNVRTYRRWENDENDISMNQFARLIRFYGYGVDIININDAFKKRREKNAK